MSATRARALAHRTVDSQELFGIGSPPVGSTWIDWRYRPSPGWGVTRAGLCDVPVLGPGWTWAVIRGGPGGLIAMIQRGSHETFGAGCPGSLGIPTLQRGALPRIGQP